MKKLLLTAVSVILSVALFAGCAKMDGIPGDNNFSEGSSEGYYWSPYTPYPEGEEYTYQYEKVTENGFVKTSENAVSTFSLDRNTASYSVARRILANGCRVSENSVRIEEFINYFDYLTYKAPENEDAVALNYKLFDCPWNTETKLMTVGLRTEDVAVSSVKNNIVLLIDVSGSMFGSDRLGLIQEAVKLLADNLGDNDTVSLVTYASGTSVVLDGVSGSDKTGIVNAVRDLSAGGSTAGAGGIELAYQTALKYYDENSNNRVILATDGDFNVGLNSVDELAEFISEKRSTGIYFTVLGVGMGNMNDSIMNTLATKGNGNYYYLDSITEAKKALVAEINGTMNTVAKDAKAKVEFYDGIEEYRLIGYENKLITVEEFEDENTDAGELGAGLAVTALYEVKLSENAGGNLAEITVKYKTPSEGINKESALTVESSAYSAVPDSDAVFISCVAEFGLILRNSAYKGKASISSVIERLNGLPGIEEDPYKNEFKRLVISASEIYIQ